MDNMATENSSDYNDVLDYVKENGVSNIEEFIKDKLESWRRVEVNIAIAGSPGAGKSSFINAIRDLNGYEEKAAKVGVGESTKEPTPYDHPNNPNIKLWDLPGMGTPNFPADTYIDQVGIDGYDAFLIFTDNRFRENDLKLAEKISSIGKRFFFIRTKIDENVRAEKRSNPPGSFNEDVMLEKIRADCSENLVHLQSNSEGIFLISNHCTAKWEFDRLRKAIVNGLPKYKQDSLILSLGVLTSLSTEMLKKKVEVLKGRIWKVASASATAAMVPIPGLSLAVDIGLMIKEITFYRHFTDIYKSIPKKKSVGCV